MCLLLSWKVGNIDGTTGLLLPLEKNRIKKEKGKEGEEHPVTSSWITLLVDSRERGRNI